MKIYLNHLDNNRFHSVYQELVRNSANEYITPLKKESYNRKFGFGVGKFIVNLIKLPTFNFVPRGDYDIIHSCQSISISDKPYVIDFEHISALGGWNQKRIESKIFKSVLKMALESDRCKKIIPWTDASAKSLGYFIESEKIRKKIEVVYPAISYKKHIKKENMKKFIFLFVAYNFFRKGGEEALKAFEIVSKTYKNAEFWIISNIDKKILNTKNEKVICFGLKEKEDILKNYYPKADCFLYPSYNDSFGMVFLEAMSFGIPIITIDDFPTKEIVENGKNGFVIDGYKKRWYDNKYMTRDGSNKWENVSSWRTEEEKSRIVAQLCEKMIFLMKNKAIQREIFLNNIKKIAEGKFSVKNRNEHISRIYRYAII